MWFSRSRRNRRRSPGQHVLDVKVRAGEARAAGTHRAARFIMVGLGTALGLYLLWRTGEWGLDEFVYENPKFAIVQFDVRTDGIISPEQLRRWSGVAAGDNLVAVDLAAVKRNLEMVSMVKTVSIERILPGTLKIRVTERHPVAQVNLLRSLASGDVVASVFQLDSNAVVIQPMDPRLSVLPLSQLSFELPAINGLTARQLLPGQSLNSAQAEAALRLIGAFEHSPMAGLVDLRSLDISSPGVIEVTTSQGSVITFSLDRLDQQLARWRLIYNWGRSAGKEVASADLAVENDVPVKWNPTGTVPISIPKSVKPLHSRRKNV
jgi:cell division septal protein FtsQ